MPCAASCLDSGSPAALGRESIGPGPAPGEPAEVVITVVWLLLLASGLGLEAAGRGVPRRVTGLAGVLSVLWRRAPGRIFLVLAWGFIGWHFFTRYTVPA
jgi:hypothetical protein